MGRIIQATKSGEWHDVLRLRPGGDKSLARAGLALRMLAGECTDQTELRIVSRYPGSDDKVLRHIKSGRGVVCPL
jgi:hypothetical protein